MLRQLSKSLAIALPLLASCQPAAASMLQQEDRQFICLAYNVFKEARSEDFRGRLAVAHVTLNRVGVGNYGNSICEVVHKSGAFSWTGSSQDSRTRLQDLQAWEAIKVVARIAMEDRDGDPTGGAVAFHSRGVRPHWVCCYRRTTIIGAHIFYSPVNT